MLNGNSLKGRFIGDRPFYREVAAVALPAILQQFIATGMGFVDSVMVGQLGDTAIAGVAVSNKYFMIMQTILFGVTGGLCIFISQYYGADDHEKGQGLFAINVLGSMTAAGLFFVLISAAPRAMLMVFVSTPATIDYGLDYLKYIRFSYLPFAVSLACMSALRSIGETSKPLIISSSAIVLNTGLNYLLIAGNLGFPAMGVAGTGLATLIARLFEMLLYLGLLARGREYFNLKVAPIRVLDKAVLLQVAKKAIPLISNELLWSIGTITIFWTYCQVNETNIASLTIVEMTGNIIFVIFGGMGAAVSVLIGTRLGASRFDEARQNARRLFALSASIAAVSGVVVFLCADLIPLLFNVSPAIRQLASQMLRIQAVLYPLMTINVMNFFILRIGGDSMGTLIMDSVFIWIFVIPLAFILSSFFKLDMIVFYLAIQSTEVLKVIVASYFYRRGRWIRNLT